MARSKQSYKVDVKNKTILRYKGETLKAEDKEAIEMYIAAGYKIKTVKRPETATVKQMREELKANPKLAKEFEEYYSKPNGFHQACAVYADFKRQEKAADKK